MGPSPKRIAGSFWPSPNGLAESPWPSPTRLLDHFGRVRMGTSPKGIAGSLWPSPNGLAESYALVAAVRNLAYQQRCARVLGTCLAWLGSWLGAHRCPEQPRLGARRLSPPFCKLTGSFKALIRTKKWCLHLSVTFMVGFHLISILH